MLNSIKKFLGLDYYISEIDQFLNEYRKNHHKLSPSQYQEMHKHADIFTRRDKPTTSTSSSQQATFWHKFNVSYLE